ncbi:hypothetical protein BD414DRAFT_578821 [Trametes punicea]|nr:hypothetical protein BD414DRAFT_578821 [Trametes punicea]
MLLQDRGCSPLIFHANPNRIGAMGPASPASPIRQALRPDLLRLTLRGARVRALPRSQAPTSSHVNLVGTRVAPYRAVVRTRAGLSTNHIGRARYGCVQLARARAHASELARGPAGLGELGQMHMERAARCCGFCARGSPARTASSRGACSATIREGVGERVSPRGSGRAAKRALAVTRRVRRAFGLGHWSAREAERVWSARAAEAEDGRDDAHDVTDGAVAAVEPPLSLSL